MFKVGDIVEVATMEDLPEESYNWAKECDLEIGQEYKIENFGEDGWPEISGYFHHPKRFKLKNQP